MSSTTAAPPIKPSDYLALDALLSDEERDIRDTVRAYTTIVKVGKPGRPYNVCSGRAVAITTIFGIIFSRPVS